MKTAKKIIMPNGEEIQLGGGIENKITNCLLEVPQMIKLELNEGVLTLKAGSQVIVPNGFEEDGVTTRFDYLDIDSDKTYVLNYSTTDKIVLMWDLKYSVLCTERFSIMSSGTTPSNYDQYGTWYDTNANIVKYTNDSGATWISSRSLPIAILDTNGADTIASIDQVFNGFGYIGSTVWVDKGVKGLIPNGRNEDGTLKNIEYTTSKVAIRDVGLTNTDCTYVIVSSNAIVDYRKLVVSETQPTTTYTLWYKPSENILYTTRGNGEPVIVVDGFASLDCYRTSTTISKFAPKQPFRAADQQDVIEKTTNKTLTLTGMSDGYCQQRFVNGDYGVMFRQDGSSFYMLLTNKGNPYGNWNDLRPFSIDLATGTTSFVRPPNYYNVVGLTPWSGMTIDEDCYLDITVYLEVRERRNVYINGCRVISVQSANDNGYAQPVFGNFFGFVKKGSVVQYDANNGIDVWKVRLL